MSSRVGSRMATVIAEACTTIKWLRATPTIVVLLIPEGLQAGAAPIVRAGRQSPRSACRWRSTASALESVEDLRPRNNRPRICLAGTHVHGLRGGRRSGRGQSGMPPSSAGESGCAVQDAREFKQGGFAHLHVGLQMHPSLPNAYTLLRDTGPSLGPLSFGIDIRSSCLQQVAELINLSGVDPRRRADHRGGRHSR